MFVFVNCYVIIATIDQTSGFLLKISKKTSKNGEKHYLCNILKKVTWPEEPGQGHKRLVPSRQGNKKEEPSNQFCCYCCATAIGGVLLIDID